MVKHKELPQKAEQDARKGRSGKIGSLGSPKSSDTRQGEVDTLQKAVELWSSEIDTLVTNEFSSTEEAVYAIVDAVLDRCTPGESVRATTREFLFNLLDSDPLIREQILSSLKIKA